MSPVVREIPPTETGSAFAALRVLRPHLTDRDAFVRLVNDVQRPEGYRLVGVFEPDEADARAVAGFRVLHALAFGRYLYVDDVSTLNESRRRGHARRLVEWLDAEAVRLGCGQLHLDSGVGPERADAHRLYMNAGMSVGALHFLKTVG